MDLDMDGRSLTCAASGCTGAGITITYFFSNIVNLNGAESKVVGPWIPATNCSGQVGNNVLGIRVEGSGYGIWNCHSVLNNVVLGVPAIFGSGIVGAAFLSTYVQNNYVAVSSTGIASYGGSVTGNFISTTGTSIFGLWALGTIALSMEDNVIMGDGDGSASAEIINVDNSSATFAGNICDEAHSDCAQCGQNGLRREHQSV